jgi:hypothetical protein
VNEQLHAFDFYGGTILFGFKNKADAEKMLATVVAKSPKQQTLNEIRKNKTGNPFSKFV